MLQADLGKLLKPKSIAVIGASSKPGNMGGRIVAALRSTGYEGSVYAIHPRAEPVVGAQAFAKVSDIPGGAEFAALCVPDHALAPSLEALASDGVGGFFIPSRAYDRELASQSTIPDRLSAIARAGGLAICGHNCMGFVNVREKLTMTFSAPAMDAAPGGVCIVSQSGSTWSGIVGSQRDVAFDTVVSAGGEVATGIADYVEYFLAQPETRVIGLVVETIREPERFIAALQQAEKRGVPVVGLFVGLSDVGARFTAAHSGGLSSPRHVLDAISRQHGLIVAQNLDEFLDCLEVFRTPRVPSGNWAAIVSDSGGERQLIADVSTRAGLNLATFRPATVQALADVLDPGMVVGNPIDCYGDGQLLMAETGQIAARDEDVGLVAVGTNLVHGRKFLEDTSNACIAISEATDKPVVVFGNISTTVSRDGARRLRELGIPVLMGTETACYATAQFLAWHGRRAEKRAAEPKNAGKSVPAWPIAMLETLKPEDAFALLADLGLPIAPFAVADDAVAAAREAARLGYPVALKTANPAIAHKTEMGGVKVNLRDGGEVLRAYDEVALDCGSRVILQPFTPGDFEIIVGMYRDPRFGVVLTVGLGGIFTEILKDSVSLLAPVNRGNLEAALRTLRGRAVLEGARGKAGVPIDALYDVVKTVSEIAFRNPGITGLDLNPIIVRNGQMTVVDTLIAAEKSQ
jgi:acyl-CoA synthetase (NDP forming)